MAQTPARRTTPARSATKTKAFEQLTEPDDEGNFTALIFGEEFKLSTDVNGWLLLMASGDASKFVDLVESLIVVETKGDERIETARLREKRRFNDLLLAQQHFGVEAVAELIADITDAAAGNADGE